jgi:DNA-binding CsgD family transcriptional regulator
MGYLSQPERVKVLTGLVPHLQQALQTQARLGEVVERSEHLVKALKLHRHGIVMVGPELLVLETNPAVDRMLASQDGLLVNQGRITAKRDSASFALRRAAHAALIGDNDGVRSGRTLLCERPSGKRPYVVHVLPLQRSAHPAGLTMTNPAAMIVIIDPELEPRPPVPLLRRFYRLTQTEAEVAVRIARGADVRHIAEELCVSVPTVRTHLQHLYDKTDTHRQAELIRLLVAIAP